MSNQNMVVRYFIVEVGKRIELMRSSTKLQRGHYKMVRLFTPAVGYRTKSVRFSSPEVET